jgi:chemotaxis protein CheC
MLDLSSMQSMHLDALREVGNIGAGNAATALSSLVGCMVDISIPKAELVSIYALDKYYGDPTMNVTAVFARSKGENPLNFMLLQDDDGANHLVELLIAKQFGMEMPADQISDEMKDSALGEIGNILLGSFLNAVNMFLGREDGISVPSVTHDMMGAILNVVASLYGEYGDTALMLKTELSVQHENEKKALNHDANILLACDPNTLEILLKKLGVL